MQRAATRKAGEHYALILLEITDLDVIRSKFGAHIGDEVLKETVNRLFHSLPEAVFIARASDTQLVAVTGIQDHNDMVMVACRVYFALSKELSVESVAMEERRPHGDAEGLGLWSPGHGTAVIVGQHDHRPAVQRRREGSLTAAVKAVAVDQGIDPG